MAVAFADLSNWVENPVAVPSTMIRVLVVHECPLFRAGLRAILMQQADCAIVGEATQQEDVLTLAREQRTDIVLLDGGLTSADSLDLVQQLRQAGVPGIMVFASPTANEETLFQFLMHGATAYEDPFLSGEELLVKLRRMHFGECLITGDVLLAQAARRERLARIRQGALLAAGLADASPSSPLVGNCKQEGNGQVSEDASLLSVRERAVLEQIARGRTLAQVALALGARPHTIKNRLNQIYEKLNVHNRTAAVVTAIREQWIVIDGIH